MEVVRSLCSSAVVTLLALLCDRLVDNFLIGGAELRGGTTIFGDKTPSALCHAIVNG